MLCCYLIIYNVNVYHINILLLHCIIVIINIIMLSYNIQCNNNLNNIAQCLNYRNIYIYKHACIHACIHYKTNVNKKYHLEV